MDSITRNENEKQENFRKEIIPHLDSTYNFALRLTSNPSDAEDLVQDSIVRAYRFFDTYQKGSNGRAWLFRILRNTYINNYRKQAKLPNHIVFDEDFISPVSNQGTKALPIDFENLTFNTLLGDEITTALDQLSEEFRLVILLCDIEGFTYEEISNMLDIPIGTIRSRLHRGRNLLKEWIGEPCLTEYC